MTESTPILYISVSWIATIIQNNCMITLSNKQYFALDSSAVCMHLKFKVVRALQNPVALHYFAVNACNAQILINSSLSGVRDILSCVHMHSYQSLCANY